MYNAGQLKDDFTNLGIKPGDTILMHSSYKSLGPLDGGAKTFYDTLLNVLGSEGTLIVPALSFDTVTRENPVFDIDSTPSCVGYLSEFFRTSSYGVIRSAHATHSCCAVGKYAKEITENHIKDITPVGENSPFAKLPLIGGKILMLGCSLCKNTSMHGVEETAEPPYCLNRENPVKYTLITGDETTTLESFRHDFSTENGDHFIQRYDRILDLLSDNEYSKGLVLDAECVLMDAKAVWKKGREKLLEDAFFFVDCPT